MMLKMGGITKRKGMPLVNTPLGIDPHPEISPVSLIKLGQPLVIRPRVLVNVRLKLVVKRGVLVKARLKLVVPEIEQNRVEKRGIERRWVMRPGIHGVGVGVG